MTFSSRRGRPRLIKEQHDLGTPELRYKHAHRLTAEPMDLCLERQLITESQHWSGLHLRWLHTLRLGAPRMTTRYDTLDTPAAQHDDPVWRAQREREYADAIDLLREHRRHRIVVRVAIFNETPRFLKHAIYEAAFHESTLLQCVLKESQHFSEGLELLSKHWKRLS